MAILASILAFHTDPAQTAAIAPGGTISFTIGTHTPFLVSTTGFLNFRMGSSTGYNPAATATDFQIDSGISLPILETGEVFDTLSFYNPGASNVNVWVKKLARQ